MEWLTVLFFILIGIILVVLEIIIIPGTTIVGILGLIMAIVGIVLGFNYFGPNTGWLIFGISGTAFGGLLYWALRGNTWDYFSIKSVVEGRVNEFDLQEFSIGQEGIATSALRPRGKAELKGKQIEVSSLGNFIDAGTRIKIINITSNHILVEPIN